MASRYGSTSPTELSPAEQLFVDAVARGADREAGAIERLCAEHPVLADELRSLHDRWRGLDRVLDGLGSSHAVTGRLCSRYGTAVDPSISLEPEGGDGKLGDELLERLSGRSSLGRYEVKEEIDRGGMGAILRVWDRDLRRHLAMKLVLERREGKDRPGTRSDSQRLARFLEEAQVTGQLDHPSIVPVHELGLDSEGRVYFTMKLVKGHHLGEVIDLVHQGREGWTVTKALGVLLKVAEALAYAHSKGVVHRDVKPANVMVGRFGQVYLMDWGLARVLDRDDSKDVRIRTDRGETSHVLSSRRNAPTPESPLYTMDGDVIGTPAYMSPEQALGHVAEIGPLSDVYALGTILYHLVSGCIPYVPRGGALNNYAIWALCQEGPPRPLEELSPQTAPELLAIAERAMSREPGDRYSTAAEFAEDLRAYLEGGVVRAYSTKGLTELRRWMRRHRSQAFVGIAAVLSVVLAILLGLESSKRRTVQAQQRALEDQRDRVVSLSDEQIHDDLVVRQASLWPPLPSLVGDLRAWLRKAGALIQRRPEHEALLAEIRATDAERADEPGPEERATVSRAWLESLSWQETRLEALLGKLDAFPERIDGVRERLDFAETVEERTVTGPEARGRWAECLADLARLDVYAGVTLDPQLGLLPLRRDPRSGLWEFWHVQSGTEPGIGEDGQLEVTADTGIVLVLLSGGETKVGSYIASDEHRPGEPYVQNISDLNAQDEEPPVDVRLDPFFISKYEVTQGQWTRLMGSNPSQYDGMTHVLGGPTHPVERVSWNDCAEAARRWALRLPTEAQYEYACRAGTTTPFSTGEERESLLGHANVADAAYVRGGGNNGGFVERFDDGHVVHAPVGSFEPNAFGLHDMHGNVWSWCRDDYSLVSPRDGDGLRPREAGVFQGAGDKTIRGGSWSGDAANARSANRMNYDASGTDSDLGLRVMRTVE